jgi:uncharacterized protein (DUF362 family)
MNLNNLKDKKISRRDVIKLSGATVVSAGIDMSPLTAFAQPVNFADFAPAAPGYVVKVHMKGMKGAIYPHSDAAKIMVKKVVTTLAGESNIKKAWLKFIKPEDKIGIKINCLGTRFISSSKEIVFAVVNSLAEAGISKDQITIIDMFASNMRGGRFEQQSAPGRVKIKAHRQHPYEKSWRVYGPAKVKFSKLFLDFDSVINIPVIKDHDLAGVTCCMKNVTFGVVEKPHVNHNIINEAIVHLWASDEIRNRVKINIVDGTSILYDGGPKANRRAMVSHQSIYATCDPVAMDAIAEELIEKLRFQNGLRTLLEVKRAAKFIQMAEQFGLGIANRTKINLKTVNLQNFTAPLQ